MSADAIAKFKEAQKEGWAHFAPLESVTTPTAARLVKFAGVRPGQRVLDVAAAPESLPLLRRASVLTYRP